MRFFSLQKSKRGLAGIQQKKNKRKEGQLRYAKKPAHAKHRMGTDAFPGRAVRAYLFVFFVF